MPPIFFLIFQVFNKTSSFTHNETAHLLRISFQIAARKVLFALAPLYGSHYPILAVSNHLCYFSFLKRFYLFLIYILKSIDPFFTGTNLYSILYIIDKNLTISDVSCIKYFFRYINYTSYRYFTYYDIHLNLRK